MNAPPDLEAPAIRRAYNAWKAGAGLKDDDIKRLVTAAGLDVSSNRVRNFGRASDRGITISAEELARLISAWAEEQQTARTSKA
ncbi:hypothetical protein [Methylobacterium aquaticum]|jgi:hypothetical protein|uniref:Uncharacterized protein n=1 Tax=Methylobacterium aquaticum TaxID=270351 RepID=A0A0J6SGE5_9HYPH|nr:hypothetical protein [Methylobacterium aquaticum]KMO34300.1 hypothetical protein VP06_14615 [Methylobacterium aquaticum]